MTGPNERDEIAWMVHRSCGCGPTVGFDGKPGPICEPDREDWAAADAILGWLAERDRRTAATALRRFADRFRPGDGNPWALHVRARARRAADRIERGE